LGAPSGLGTGLVRKRLGDAITVKEAMLNDDVLNTQMIEVAEVSSPDRSAASVVRVTSQLG
jgi:hypothetical protein